jgi:hypothetical protein
MKNSSQTNDALMVFLKPFFSYDSRGWSVEEFGERAELIKQLISWWQPQEVISLFYDLLVWSIENERGDARFWHFHYYEPANAAREFWSLKIAGEKRRFGEFINKVSDSVGGGDIRRLELFWKRGKFCDKKEVSVEYYSENYVDDAVGACLSVGFWQVQYFVKPKLSQKRFLSPEARQPVQDLFIFQSPAVVFPQTELTFEEYCHISFGFCSDRYTATLIGCWDDAVTELPYVVQPKPVLFKGQKYFLQAMWYLFKVFRPQNIPSLRWIKKQMQAQGLKSPFVTMWVS